MTDFSVVITNYNYLRYLRRCIQSVLSQRFDGGIQILIDDGSTDGSQEYLRGLPENIEVHFKANGGQISALNYSVNFWESSKILFLDADDWLPVDAIAIHHEALSKPGIGRSQGYMRVVDERGEPTGDMLPSPDRHLKGQRELTLRNGPGAYISTPHSGNAWSREFVKSIFPLPEVSKIGADAFLMDSSPIFGEIATSDKVVAMYTSRPGSMSDRKFTIDTLQALIDGYQTRQKVLADYIWTRGISSSDAPWIDRNWRFLTLMDLLARMSGKSRPNALLQLSSAFDTSGGLPKRLLTAGVIAALRILPLAASLAVARRTIKLRYM